MKPFGELTPAEVNAGLDHSMVVAVISLVAEQRPQADGARLARMAAEACMGLKPGDLEAQDVARIVMEVMDASS